MIKKKNIIRIVIIIILILCTTVLINKHNKPITGNIIGVMNYPRVCASAIFNNDSLIILGGINEQNNAYNKGEVFDLKNQKSSVFESNFNNSYGNFLFKMKNHDIVNVQLIKFDESSKFGIEILNKETNKMDVINSNVYPRNKESLINYLKLDDKIINKKISLGNLYIVGGVDYRNFNKIKGYEYFNFNDKKSGREISFNKELNGISSRYAIDDQKIYDKKTWKILGDFDKVNGSSDLYEIVPDFVSFNFYNDKEQLVIINKTASGNNLQAFWWDPYSNKFIKKPIKLPKELLDYKLKDAFQIDPFSIRLIYAKGNNFYILNYYTGRNNVDLIGHFKTKCNNPTFIYLTDDLYHTTIYAIGGLLYEDNNFNCNNIANKTNKSCDIIEEIK